MVSLFQFRLTRLACVALCLAFAPGLTFAPGEASAQLFGKRDNGQDAEMALRLSTLEDQVRQLNGQIEQLTFQVRQLQDQMQRAAADYEYRFQQLGQGGTGGSGAVVQPQQPQVTQQAQPQVATQSGSTVISGQPQTLGQVPGQPLDLSSALEQPLGGSGQFGSGDGPVQGQQGTGLLGTGQANTQLAAAPTNDPKDLYDLSYGYILRGEFDTAEASFRQFLAQFPGDPLAGNAQYWLGESLFARGLYRDSADAFLKGYSEYPQGAKAPESLYKLGMSLKELGQGEAACSTFSEIPRRYPKAPQAVLERARTEAQKSGC